MKRSLLFLIVMPLVVFGQPREQKREMSEQGRKLAEFYQTLTKNYLDTIDYDVVVEKSIRDILSGLDPHSTYLTPGEKLLAAQDFGRGFAGVGVRSNIVNDTMRVVSVTPDGPASKAGLTPGDCIVGIDGNGATGLTGPEMAMRMGGKKGSPVTLTVFRPGAGRTFDLTIVRDDISPNTVEIARRIDGRTGYIKVDRFGATTGKEFSDAFAGLGEGIDGLILDLRGNGGGLVDQAVEMSEFFLDKGQVIFSTEGNMHPPQVITSGRDGTYNAGRLIVLVDLMSASASEIVAGALQDWDRAIVVGQPTFGKGLVQMEFVFGDGSAVRITTSRYLTPTGRAIQRPYERGHTGEYYAGQLERLTRQTDDTAAPEAIPDPNGKVFKTLRSGRKVYGGNGIRPDVIVEIDEAYYSAGRDSLDAIYNEALGMMARWLNMPYDPGEPVGEDIIRGLYDKKTAINLRNTN